MKISKRIILGVVIALFVYIHGSLAQGGYAGAFLRIGLGARQQALANSSVALIGDGSSFYYNPALTGFQTHKVISLQYSFMSLDRKFNFIGYSMPVPPGAAFSVGWINSGVGDLKSYNSIGEQTGNIDHGLNAFFFNFARNLNEKLSVGVSIKHVRESLGMQEDDYLASGWGWDIGMIFCLHRYLTIGAALRDLGTKFRANTEELFEQGGITEFKFPTIFALGFSYHTMVPWLKFQYTWNKTPYDNEHLAGLEVAYRDQLALRIGYGQDILTFGAGLGLPLFKKMSRLDYAFVPSRLDEGGSHVFTWQFNLD